MAKVLTWQQRNALADQPAVKPIPPQNVTISSPPSFTDITNGTLGALGTAADGWDAIFNAVMATASVEQPAINALDALLALAAFTPGQIGTSLLGPIGDSLAAMFKAGDAWFTDYQCTLAGAGGCAGGGFTPPPAGGGGGGGGGGGTGGGTGGSGEGGCGIHLDRIQPFLDVADQAARPLRPPVQSQAKTVARVKKLPVCHE